MCHGHPHYHLCSHTSTKWLYCPEANFDLNTGHETPCQNPIFSTMQPSNTDCPLSNCHYKALRGSWTCCKCGHNANNKGWCEGITDNLDGSWDPVGMEPKGWQTCGHGCCDDCGSNSKYKDRWL